MTTSTDLVKIYLFTFDFTLVVFVNGKRRDIKYEGLYGIVLMVCSGGRSTVE